MLEYAWAALTPEEFWDAISESEALALLKAAPPLASPWKKRLIGSFDGREHWDRRIGVRVVAEVWELAPNSSESEKWASWSTVNPERQHHPTKEGAMMFRDAELRDAGWILEESK